MSNTSVPATDAARLENRRSVLRRIAAASAVALPVAAQASAQEDQTANLRTDPLSRLNEPVLSALHQRVMELKPVIAQQVERTGDIGRVAFTQFREIVRVMSYLPAVGPAGVDMKEDCVDIHWATPWGTTFTIDRESRNYLIESAQLDRDRLALPPSRLVIEEF